MPVMVPWNRTRRAGPRGRQLLPLPGPRTRNTSRSPRTRVLLVLTCLFVASVLLGTIPRLRRSGGLDLEPAWEISCSRPLAISEEKILVAGAGPDATQVTGLINAGTGSVSILPAPIPDDALLAETGIAWIEGQTLFFIQTDGTRTSLDVPPDTFFLTAFETAGPAWTVVTHPGLGGEGSWSGTWSLACFSPQGLRWSLNLPGTPVLARSGTAGLLVGVTDPASGPTSCIYLLSPSTGQILWSRRLGPGFFRETQFLPSGDVFVSWSSGVLVLSSRGEILCHYEPKESVISAAAGTTGIYIIEGKSDATGAHLTAVSRDARVTWQRRVSAPALVKYKQDMVLCIESHKVRAFSGHSGEEIWYYETGKGTTWLLDSGILHWDGQRLRLFPYGFYPQ